MGPRLTWNPQWHDLYVWHDSYVQHDSKVWYDSLVSPWVTRECYSEHTHESVMSHMGWLRSVGLIKLQVSFAEYRLFYRALLQKRPVILIDPTNRSHPIYKSYSANTCEGFMSHIEFFSAHTWEGITIHLWCADLTCVNTRVRAMWRGGGLGSRPKKMYGERLGDGVEYHLMSPTPHC